MLWDMDGTLVDTEPYWMASETTLVHSFGGVWTHEDAMSLVGSGLPNSARILQGKGVALSEQEIIDRMTDEVVSRLADDIPWRPGALELLTDLHRQGVTLALVTMSIARMAAAVIERIPYPAFHAVVTGDMVANSKPHPEPYLLAAETLGVDIAHCIAIEDSHAGLASAVSAGAIAIGVPHQLELSTDAPYALWSTLEGRSTADISTLYSHRTNGTTR